MSWGWSSLFQRDKHPIEGVYINRPNDLVLSTFAMDCYLFITHFSQELFNWKFIKNKVGLLSYS